MEADWAAEIGADSPEIVIPWSGVEQDEPAQRFIDLRLHPEAIEDIHEVAGRLALRRALHRLNRADSPVFTSKCDVWTLAKEEIDPFEFDCYEENGLVGVASYIDVVARDAALYASFGRHEIWAKTLVNHLRERAIYKGRVDMAIRAARITVETDTACGFGLTLYAAGCGTHAIAASAAWEEVLEAAIAATIFSGASLTEAMGE